MATHKKLCCKLCVCAPVAGYCYCCCCCCCWYCAYRKIRVSIELIARCLHPHIKCIIQWKVYDERLRTDHTTHTHTLIYNLNCCDIIDRIRCWTQWRAHKWTGTIQNRNHINITHTHATVESDWLWARVRKEKFKKERKKKKEAKMSMNIHRKLQWKESTV